MEINRLRYFYEIATCEHMTKASERLHIAQPALSKAIKELEEELGVELFYKSGRGIKLTRYGEFLYEEVKPILEAVNQLPISVEKMKKAMENTISVNVLAASTVMTDIIIAFKQKHPEVIFKMTQKENARCDITVSTNGYGAETVGKKRRIIEEQIFLAVPTEEAPKNERANLEQFRISDFIALSGSRRFRPLCDALCGYAGFKPRIIFESDSLIAVKNLIAAGVGVAFWPKFSWGRMETPKVKLITVENPSCFREITVNLTEERTETVKEFFEFVVEELNRRNGER